MGVEVHVHGDREVMAKLERLASVDARRATRKGTRAGAKLILPTAKAFAPVGATGQLRRAIRVRSAKRSRRYIGAVVRVGKGWFKGNQFYGAFQEWGWKIGKRNKRNMTTRRQVPGKHYMERAYKSKRGAAMHRARQVILAEIEAAVRR